MRSESHYRISVAPASTLDSSKRSPGRLERPHGSPTDHFWGLLDASRSALGISWPLLGTSLAAKKFQNERKSHEKLKKMMSLGLSGIFQLSSRRSEVDFGPAEMDFGPPGGDLDVISLQNLCEFLAKSMQDPSEIQENILSNPNA